jgi:hypothetical protein
MEHKTDAVQKRIVKVALAVAMLATACGGGSSPVAEADPNQVVVAEAAAEVFLEPVASLGSDPFFTEVAAMVPEPITELVTISLPASTLDDSQLVIGTDPGLYGGTRDSATCNREQIVAFLEANPEKAAAWAAVQDLEPIVRAGPTKKADRADSNGLRRL